MVIARGMGPTLNVSSTSFWNPSFSSRMATGNKPPYAVRLLPSKSYGVEAPILLGSGITRSAPCGTRLSSLCSLLRLTIWVTPRSRLAKLELRGLSVLQQDFRGPQVVLSFSPSYSTQRPCIGQVQGDPPQRHGPYYQLSFTRKGKSRTQFVKREDLPLLQQQVRNYQRLKTLMDRWVALGMALSQLRLRQQQELRMASAPKKRAQARVSRQTPA